MGLISKRQILCLGVLGALVLCNKEHRSFFGAQHSLLQFLAHCCRPLPQDAPVADVNSDSASVRRAAARCLANLSPHPAAREWISRSDSLRIAYAASTADAAVRTYLGAALGV